VAVQRCADIPDPDDTGESCGKSTDSEVSLAVGELLGLALSETLLEPVGEIGRRLYCRKIPEQKQRPTDLGIVLCTGVTFSEMSLHADQLDTGERIVYEG